MAAARRTPRSMTARCATTKRSTRVAGSTTRRHTAAISTGMRVPKAAECMAEERRHDHPQQHRPHTAGARAGMNPRRVPGLPDPRQLRRDVGRRDCGFLRRILQLHDHAQLGDGGGGGTNDGRRGTASYRSTRHIDDDNWCLLRRRRSSRLLHNPTASGDGNITNDPGFVDAPGGDYRLSVSSPCFNAGSNEVRDHQRGPGRQSPHRGAPRGYGGLRGAGHHALRE